jgi:hypothetical protein
MLQDTRRPPAPSQRYCRLKELLLVLLMVLITVVRDLNVHYHYVYCKLYIEQENNQLILPNIQWIVFGIFYALALRYFSASEVTSFSCSMSNKIACPSLLRSKSIYFNWNKIRGQVSKNLRSSQVWLKCFNQLLTILSPFGYVFLSTRNELSACHLFEKVSMQVMLHPSISRKQFFDVAII